MRRNWLWPLWMVVLLAATSVTEGGTVRIVERGQPRAAIVVPAGADQQIKEAAKLLAEYVKQSSGAALPVVEESVSAVARPAQMPVTIHVGQDAYVKGINLGLDKLDDDGFVIRAADDGHVVIAGRTPYGTEFGTDEFLERYVGVRWLMPGEDGDDVPQQETIEIPREEIRQEPVFFSRLLSGLASDTQVTWARRNRMHGRIEFHHNLLNLFPPDKYAKTHPEFYPIHNGKRYIPPTNDTHGWQPCFSAPGTVQEAIQTICRYFDEHPEATSFSLGVTDSSGHCQCGDCQAQDPAEPNFLGLRNVSDRYFAWCNRVVEGVLAKHPDKWFGCLAYSEVAQAPSRVKVHPRIIPYMTYDRMKWIDPELRAEGQRRTQQWQAASPVVGWYDYIYGSPYCLPRVWFHQMADYLRFAQANGVKAHYAEAYPNWGEGPKLYVALKLLWDPQQDVDHLLRDWYARAVGPQAADDLAAYYAHWEDFWTRRILQSKWFTKQGQYLAFYSASYLADVAEEEIRASRRLLEQVVQKAVTPRQKARAGLLLRAFEYYEASALACARGPKPEELAVPTEADALRALDEGPRLFQMAAKRLQLVREFASHPVLVHPLEPSQLPRLAGDTWAASRLWSAFDWARKSEPVRQHLRQLADSPVDAIQRHAKAMLRLIEPTGEPISKNPSFEDPEGRWPAGWNSWVKFGIGQQTASPQAARTGKLGVLCQGMKRGGPFQDIDVTAGCYAAMAAVRIPKAPTGEATVSLNIDPLDEKGEHLGSGFSASIRATVSDWRWLAVAGQVPATIRDKPVKRVRLVVIVDGFQPDEEVHIDDVALLKIE